MDQSVEPTNTGPPGPLQAGDILYFTRVTLFITLLCMGYTLSRPTPAKGKEQNLLLPDWVCRSKVGRVCRRGREKLPRRL
jgi:hypothetical protein